MEQNISCMGPYFGLKTLVESDALSPAEASNRIIIGTSATFIDDVPACGINTEGLAETVCY